ncbi:TPA: Shedu anti-phage system protein SduA domain-containing protein [Stenotrophomonas maltophilia]
MSGTEELTKVFRKTASSGKLDYVPVVVLNETSKTKLHILGFLIPHSDHTGFKVKLEGFTKTKGASWVEDREKTINLTEVSTLKLFKYLQTHLPLTDQPEAGEFILIKVANGAADLTGHDPQSLAGALTKVLSHSDLVQHLANTELTHELTTALRGSIRLSEMRSAVAELRSSLGRGESAEQVYQSWCEKHCWAFGNAYVVRDEVRAITTGDNIDLMLPNVIAGYRDIVELKRPDMEVLLYDKAHKNYYFSAEVSKAIGQFHRYLDMLYEFADKGLQDHKEVVAYHPRATIVIGRSHDWSDERQRALHGLNRRMNGITVMTYDHLLAQGERLLEMLSPAAGPEAASVNIVELDDDIPW